MRNSKFAGILLGGLFLFLLSTPTDLMACTCKKQTDRFNKLMAKRTAAVADGNAAKTTTLTAMVARHVKNWKPIPGCPPPAIPAAWCPTTGGGKDASGRGLGLGAVNIAGDTARVKIFLRNQNSVDVEIVELSLLGVAGDLSKFELLDTLKSLTIPPLTDTICEVRVAISSTASIGDQAFFAFDVFNTVEGLFWNEMEPFSVSVSDVRVEPVTSIATVPMSGTFPVQWKISNPGASAVTKSYSVFTVGDPRSTAQLNDTSTVYPIFSAYPVDKTAGGGSVSLNPGEDILIDCDMISNEVCEPAMLDCKGLSLDGGLVCCAMPNDFAIPSSPPIMAVGLDLMGIPAGGQIQIALTAPDGSFFPLFVPTFPGQPVEQIADQMVQVIFDQYIFQNGFPFQAVAADNFVEIFGPPGGNASMVSLDPGLNFVPPQCEPPGLEVPQLLPGDQLLIQWRANDPPAVEYDIILQPLSGGGPPMFFTVPNQPGLIQQFVTPALEVNQYATEIVAICDLSVPIFSNPSAPIIGEVPPCNNGNPPVGLGENFLATGVELFWDPIETSLGCQLQGVRLAPLPSVSGNLNVFGGPGSPPSSAFAPYSVAAPTGFGSWQWQAICACNIDPLNITPPSAPSIFTIAPVRIDGSPKSEISIYPNPAVDQLFVSLKDYDMVDKISLAKISNTLGQVLAVHEIGDAGNGKLISIGDLPTGLYFLQVDNFDAISFRIER